LFSCCWARRSRACCVVAALLSLLPFVVVFVAETTSTTMMAAASASTSTTGRRFLLGSSSSAFGFLGLVGATKKPSWWCGVGREGRRSKLLRINCSRRGVVVVVENTATIPMTVPTTIGLLFPVAAARADATTPLSDCLVSRPAAPALPEHQIVSTTTAPESTRSSRSTIRRGCC